MNIEQKIKQTLSKLKLNKRKKILVALSGGKDSSVVAYVLKKLGYQVEGFHIDLKMGKYSENCSDDVKKLCDELDIKLHVYDIRKEMGNSMCNIRLNVQSRQDMKGKLKNCAICGVIKKWILNREARKLKADYIATGHHLDDETQTFLLNILKGSPELNANTGVITKNVSDKKFIPRIKPLFYILEKDIKEYSLKHKLPVVYEKCPCAIDSYRIQIREFMKSLSDKQKENLMRNELKMLDEMKKEQKQIKYCEICGEPARNKVCRMCELVRIKK